MGKINVLSFEIANLIAAGEVVERPSSVLKELIENSIDAGATEIVAEIKRGGVALIRVTDNGCGIDKDDLPVSLKRHATSKISERDDLYSIMTLGFRGEALAAISSVSEVTIITKTKESDTAYMLSSQGGKVLDISEVGASDGTTVVVENLFFNVPARRKFLKKDATEAMNVTALVEKIALSRPDISIQLLVDGEEKFKTPGDNQLLNTIRAIFGKEFATKMLYADGVSEGIRVSGYIGRSDNVRKNRNLENVFINGRYVKSLTAQAAIEKAYTSYIATEHFPACALFIEMHPGIVDVNVHPAKLEVKFSDERKVFEAVYYTVKRTLEESEYRPDLKLGGQKTEYNPVSAFVPIGEKTSGEQISFSSPAIGNTSHMDTKSYTHGFSGNNSLNLNGEKRSYGLPKDADSHAEKNVYFNSTIASSKYTGESLTPRESLDLLAKYKTESPSIDIPKSDIINDSIVKRENEILPEYKIIGEAFDCYIIVEKDKELILIDKHAAHERIIYEDLKRGRNDDKFVSSQKLLLPITVILTPDELSYLKEYAVEFEKIGFAFQINERSCDLLAIPTSVAVSDAEGLVVEMLGELSASGSTPKTAENLRLDKALYIVACKAAIKGGRVYDDSTSEWIVKRVFALPDITVCPHGRPIAYKLSKNELDRQFDRIK